MRKIDADRLKNDPYMQEFPLQLAIDNAPTVEEVTGEWIETNNKDQKRCSNCDVIAFIGLYPNGNANYCPNCGSKNREV